MLEPSDARLVGRRANAKRAAAILISRSAKRQRVGLGFCAASLLEPARQPAGGEPLGRCFRRTMQKSGRVSILGTKGLLLGDILIGTAPPESELCCS